MGGHYTMSLYNDYEKLTEQYEDLTEIHRRLKQKLASQNRELKNARETNDRLTAELKDKDGEIDALKKEVARLTALHDMDSTNSGISTAKTPIHKKKHIPNSRPKSTRSIGGQKGHAKHKLEKFSDDEITDQRFHKVDVCPSCGGELQLMDDEITKDETEYEVVVKKIRHHFPQYRCKSCGKKTRAHIPANLKEDNQYGARVRALTLALGNDGNVSMNKISKTIYGLTDGEIDLSEGFIAKQQRWAARELQHFMEELAKEIRQRSLVYWDDTVIMINKRRGCLRFYGDEKIALYFAHDKKNKAGLDEDGILSVLPKTTTVMHDHNKVNYNAEYSFGNIECNVHLLRDLQKATDNLGHKWSAELKELLTATNTMRNEAMERGEESFGEERVREFFAKFDDLIVLGMEENKKESAKRYYVSEERALLARLLKYKDNYLSWVTNFGLPFSNNVSERALRSSKTKLKVAGQFKNCEMAKCYATIKSYIETCNRNGIDAIYALQKLCCGEVPHVADILNKGADV